jgi:molybdate-binding protein/DNA-binding XRE family transcriptional regulator
MSNRVRERRLAMSFTQAALANKTGISRQALLAIETKRAAPSVKVALRLAHALATTVDALFSDDVAARPEPLQSRIGGRVAMAWIGERWIALALDERDIAADALAANGHATFLGNVDDARRNVIIMGCAPVLGPICDRLNNEHGGARYVWLPRSSTTSLEALRDAGTHVAGSHLFDVERVVRRCTVVTLGHWEVGLLVAKGNPLHIREAAHVGRRRVRLITRERGSGARRMLERALAAEGAPKSIAASKVVAMSHHDVARGIALGAFDVGPGVREAALTHGLDFVPLGVERFDLAVASSSLEDSRVTRLFDALTRSDVRREMHALGYDTERTGVRAAS